MNPEYPTPKDAKATAIAGTPNSEPLADEWPCARRAVANSSFMIATMNSGISTTKTTVDGSLNITRNSCRMITQLVAIPLSSSGSPRPRHAHRCVGVGRRRSTTTSLLRLALHAPGPRLPSTNLRS